jgi:hypothetical protein
MSKKTRKRTGAGPDITPLGKLPRHKGVLKSPLSILGNTFFSSWVNEVLADALWSVLLAGLLPREKVLAAFRLIIMTIKRNKESYERTMLVHSQLADLTPLLFDDLFAPIIQDEEARHALSCLLVFETLPDKHHWQRLLASSASEWPDVGERLAIAVATCFDHQSQEATDCRWLRVMTVLAEGNLLFDVSMGARFEELVHYPDRGDMRSVRPSIRALEMSTRDSVRVSSRAAWSEEFWSECWKNTGCIPSHRDEGTIRTDHSNVFEQIVSIHDNLTKHFLETVRTTAVDPRHDGAFGLTFYVIHLLTFALKAETGQTVASRSMLRTALEAYITLSYLTTKDDSTIWMQYRNYGYGQNKLAFLKNISITDVPSFLTLELLEAIANEDMWVEFQEIKLGAWSDKNLRKMAEEAGVKDIYDKYYDVLSGYVHGNWTAVRHAVFGECLNPLHRFHRIPLPPREFQEDAVPDLVRFANLCLERLTTLYPRFKPRFQLSHS